MNQILDMLAAPRRALWGDTTGAQLLQRHLGADPEGLGGQVGGFLLDALMDPMTYLIPAGIGAAGKLAPRLLGMLGKAGPLAAVGDEIGTLTATRQAAQKALVAQELQAEAAQAAQASRIGGLQGVADFPSMASGATKSYVQASPEAAEMAAQLGLGSPTEGGGLMLNQGRPPVAMQLQRGGAGGGSRIGMRAGADVPSEGLSPYERYLLMREAGAGGASQSVHSGDLAGMLADRPIPSQPAIMGQFSDVPVGMEHLAGQPASSVLESTQDQLRRALARRGELQQAAISPQELAMMAAMGGAGGVGGYMGMQR